MPSSRSFISTPFSSSATRVMRTLRANGRAGFFALVERFDRAGVIVTFLAILELIRRGRVGYEQQSPFDDVELSALAA